MIHVYLPHSIQESLSAPASLEVQAETVGALIEALEAQFPGIATRLTAHGRLAPGLSAVIDGRIASLGLLQPLPDGAEVHFLPALGGG